MKSFLIPIKITCSSVFFFFFSGNIKADDNDLIKKLMLKPKSEEKLSYSIKPSALNLGIDIFTPTYSYFKYGSSFHNYNFHSSIDFNKVFADFDFGLLRYNKKQPSSLPAKYQPAKHGGWSPIQYDDMAFNLNFKLGFSYNFLQKNRDRNAIFAGLGYNFAFCNNRVSGQLFHIDNGEHNDGIDTQTQTFLVHWMDIALGLRLAISENFYIGHTTHINILKHFIRENKTCLIPYFISGYGPEENSFNLKFEFFIGYNFLLYDDPMWKDKE